MSIRLKRILCAALCAALIFACLGTAAEGAEPAAAAADTPVPEIRVNQLPAPGRTVRYYVYGAPEGAAYTWSVEGEGAEIDPQTGEMTMAEGLPDGAWFTITAAPEDDYPLVTHACVNYSGVLANLDWTIFTTSVGFIVPKPQGDAWSFYTEDNNINDIYITQGDADENGRAVYIDAGWYTMKQFEYMEDPEVAVQAIEALRHTESESIRDMEAEIIDLDGHPVGLEKYTYYKDGEFNAYIGVIIAPRNNRLVRIRVFSDSVPLDAEKAQPVSLVDLRTLAAMMGYKEERAPFTKKNTKLTVSAAGSAEAVNAGKTLQFTAAFEDTENINKKNGNDGVTWSVVNAATGEPDPMATISAKGKLSVSKNLATVTELTVTAVSDVFGSSATYKVTAMPVIKGFTVTPKQLTLYVGQEKPATLQAVMNPGSVPAIGVTWTPNKKDFLEITELEPGLVSVQPLAAGKGTITVKESGGKRFTVNVSVLVPVETVTISAKGNPVPGGTVRVTADVQPAKASNRKIKWSLDVGKDIATVNDYGRLVIKRETAPGTKITVICTAAGAAEPVVATLELTVE